MKSIWQNFTTEERSVMLQRVAAKEELPQPAIEKDWWVTAVLKCLFETEAAPAMLFKGGTSLSKGWHLIERLSEDVDIAIDHSFFGVNGTNKSQREKLRKMARRYIHEQLSPQLKKRLEAMGVKDFRIENVTTKNDGSPIDCDKDPTVILVWYEPVCQETIDYIQPRVKVEISCLSMSEPKEVKPIRSLISGLFAEEDEGTGCGVALVVPERTFLEKAFLLNEEFQKEHPRHVRMSRHLYDLYKLMDTDYGKAALADGKLYGEIVKHRSLYYALKHVDYNRHSPELIDFCPAEALLPDWSRDYDNMLESFIYGKAPSFDELIEAIRGLVERFRLVHCGSESTFG